MENPFKKIKKTVLNTVDAVRKETLIGAHRKGVTPNPIDDGVEAFENYKKNKASFAEIESEQDQFYDQAA